MRFLLLCTIAVLLNITSCKQSTSTNQVADNTTEDIYLKDISLEEAAEKISTGEAIFIDVRTPQEIGEGMIPGSIHIDFNSSDFEQKLEKLDKEKEYVVYCRSGGRSSKACKRMNELGFKKLNNMTGGYSKWSKK